MREIKFRVWCENKKEWESHGLFMSMNGQLSDMNRTPHRRESHIVEQFTGLHDSQGVEIYEGDILRSKKNIFIDDGFSEQIVRFSEGCFVVDKVNLNILLPDFGPEVIGTIHDSEA